MASFDASGPGSNGGPGTHPPGPGPAARNIPELLTDLVRDLGDLFRKEARLVRAEISEAGKRLAVGIEMIGAGAVILLVALFVLVQALVLALGTVMGPGWAALLVGGVLALVGVFLVMKGRRDLSAAKLVPERTIEQTSRDARLAREQI